MSAAAPGTWQRYFLPAFSFMSVAIGGGYATGRELVEFFMPAGPVGGLIGMAVTAVLWSVVFAWTLELARTTQSFEYRAFFKALLGRGWFLFELAYLAILLLVLAVLCAASGAIGADVAHAPEWAGTVLFLAVVAGLAWRGSAAVESALSIWGVVLYVAYAAFLVVCLSAFGPQIKASLAAADTVKEGWLKGGISYAGYNMAVIPALLFCARHLQRRRDSVVAGLLGGPVAMLPGILLYVALLARYPEISSAPIPLQVLLRALDQPWLSVAMQVAIFGTLVQTGIGVLHGFNERLISGLHVREASAGAVRAGVALGIPLIAMVLSAQVGIIGLIAQGYGLITWVIIAVYVVPLLTLGTWRLARRNSAS